MEVKKLFLSLSVTVAVASMATAQVVPVPKFNGEGHTMERGTPVSFAGVKKLAIASSENLTADFSIKDASTETKVWTEGFDSSRVPSGWTIDPTTKVTWAIKKNTSSSFSQYDANDVSSLYVEGPIRVYEREISSATSPSIQVPASAMLRAYVYYSLNYDDMCRLLISVSTDNFADDITEVWNSRDGEGEKPSTWRPVAVSLADYAGKEIRVRFTYSYGSSDEIFKTGGYMGDFYIDGISVTAPGTVESVDVMTGEVIDFVDCSSDGVVSWEWSFPGGEPSTSTEKNPSVYYTVDGSYDVSLTVTDKSGSKATITRPAFAKVTGTEPVAHIGLPATFRYSATRLPMIAPLVPVTYTDASDGYPTEQSWVFTGVDTKANEVTLLDGPQVDVAYSFMHQQTVGLTVSNIHGTSSDLQEVSVEYSGTITNFRPDDVASVFDLEGRGEFPGTNSMNITAYAEKFSKPSRPIIVEGAYVYFTRAEAEEVIDQISSVGVHLYTSENGLPGKRIDSFWWSVFELDLPSVGNLVGTAFPFTDMPVVDDEFFIVVDGLPEKNETCTVSFAMADFRAEGNTAYMLKNGEWIDVSTYFPAGHNHTSYLIQPSIYHSVMAPATIGAEALVEFDHNGGTKDFELFSYLGYETPVATGADWCRVVNDPNGMTVDILKIECDPLPAGLDIRETVVMPTDGISTLEIRVRQTRNSGVAALCERADSFRIEGLAVSAESGDKVCLLNMQGVLVSEGTVATAPTPGYYIAVSGGYAAKVSLR